MGGFFRSKDLEKMLTDPNREYIPDDMYEALEQCIVLTKEWENKRNQAVASKNLEPKTDLYCDCHDKPNVHKSRSGCSLERTIKEDGV